MLSEDLIMFFRNLSFLIPILFWDHSEVYLYIGITSLCLYNNAGIPDFQDGKFHKKVLIQWCKTQKTEFSNEKLLTTGRKI